MELKINLDRGVTVRRHPTGMSVYMYKDDPGVFLSAFGTPVDAKMAAEAGFDVETLSAAAEKKRRVAAAMEAIDREYANVGDHEEVIAETAGFKLLHYGLGRHKVIDPDGNSLSPRALTEAEGRTILTSVAGPKSPLRFSSD